MLHTMHKEKFRRITELNAKGKFIDPTEKNVVEYLCELWLKKTSNATERSTNVTENMIARC